MKSSGKPIEILTKLNELAGFAPDQEIELFEVCESVWIYSLAHKKDATYTRRKCVVSSI